MKTAKIEWGSLILEWSIVITFALGMALVGNKFTYGRFFP